VEAEKRGLCQNSGMAPRKGAAPKVTNKRPGDAWWAYHLATVWRGIDIGYTDPTSTSSRRKSKKTGRTAVVQRPGWHVKTMEDDKTTHLKQIPLLRDGTPAQDVITPVCGSITGGLGKLALGFFKVLAAIAHPGDDDDPETKAIRSLWINRQRKIHTCMLVHVVHDAVTRKRDCIHNAIVAECYGQRQQRQADDIGCWSAPSSFGGVVPLGIADVSPLSPFVDATLDLGEGAHGATMESSVWSVRAGGGGGSFSCSRGGARAD